MTELRHLLLDVADMTAQFLNRDTSRHKFTIDYDPKATTTQHILFRNSDCGSSKNWESACKISADGDSTGDLTQLEYHLHAFISEPVVLKKGTTDDLTTLKRELTQMAVDSIRPQKIQLEPTAEIRNLVRNASIMAVEQLASEIGPSVRFDIINSRNTFSDILYYQKITAHEVPENSLWNYIFPPKIDVHLACLITVTREITDAQLQYHIRAFQDEIVTIEAQADDIKQTLAQNIVNAISPHIETKTIYA